MGLFSTKNKPTSDELPGPLNRPSQPIGLFQNYIDHEKPVVVAIHENQYSWGNEDSRYQIMVAASGSIAIKPHFSWKTTVPKEIRDPHNNPLFNFKMKTWSSTHTFQAFSPAGGDNPIFTVKNTTRYVSTKIALSYVNTMDGRPVEITLEDSKEKRSAIQKHEGVFKLTSDPAQPILGYITPNPPTIIQESAASKAVGDKKRMGSYYLTIAPGVDGALLMTLCLCLDEIKMDKELAKAAGDGGSIAIG